MQLRDLVAASGAVAATRSRLKKRAALAACLSAALPEERALVVNYLSGALPQGKIGLGPALISKLTPGQGREPSTVELLELDQTFDQIAATKGAGSGKARQETLTQLYARLSDEEGRFVSRLVLGELRQGALEGVLIDSLADATELPVQELRRAVMLAGDPAPVAVAAWTDGLAGLAQFQLELFKPVKPMLAQPADDMPGAMEALGEAALETKLDGARVQIHREGTRVEFYSRQLNPVTESLPEIAAIVADLPLDSGIFDGEVLALRDDGRPLPFQVTMRRFGRRLNVAEMTQKIPLRLFVFDCLMLNGESLIDEPLSRRIQIMEQALPAPLRVNRLISASREEATGFLTDALSAGHEGVMAKSLTATYMAGSRGADWLKIKQAHTLDLVVLAAEWGSGRRKGKLSNLHLGARDAESGEFVMLGKTFKGLTDRLLAWQTERLLALQTHTEGQVVFVKPELVVEIAFSDVQTSPQYPAGMALRFARVKRYRKDKTPLEADTLATVHQLHQAGS
ncbi:MAG: ATP-dependent DNA ligase [Pseudomonadota bacterium]